MASDFPRERRLHYPHYSTMYEHTPSDPQKRRHETIRSIYLWNVPAEKRADRPRESTERQRNFETKYRHVLKERADHEWSRTYYYPPADTKPTDSSHLGLVDRLLADKRDEIAAYVPPSRAKKEAAAAAAASGSSASPRSYGRESTKESPRERQKPTRTEINHPAVEASRASRRLNSYLDDSKDVSSRSSTGRYDRSASRRSAVADDSVASSSAPYSSSNGRSSRYARSTTDDDDAVASSSASRRSRVSSKSSESSKPSKHAQADQDSDKDDLSDFDVDAIVAEVMAQHNDVSSSDDESPSDDTPAPAETEEVPVQVGEEIAAE